MALGDLLGHAYFLGTRLGAASYQASAGETEGHRAIARQAMVEAFPVFRDLKSNGAPLDDVTYSAISNRIDTGASLGEIHALLVQFRDQTQRQLFAKSRPCGDAHNLGLAMALAEGHASTFATPWPAPFFATGDDDDPRLGLAADALRNGIRNAESLSNRGLVVYPHIMREILDEVGLQSLERIHVRVLTLREVQQDSLALARNVK